MGIKLLKYFLALMFMAETIVIEVDSSYNPADLQRTSCKPWINDINPEKPTITTFNLDFKVYYVITNYRLNWYDAFAYCRAEGLFLASPATAEENNFLIKKLKEKNLLTGVRKDDYWLSLTDLSKSKSFVWMSTGKKVEYSNWMEGEPNNGEYDKMVEHCGHLYTWSGEAAWNDYMCDCPQNFICEK